MAEAKRKHVATGKPRGGSRPGSRPNAGRPEGSKNTLGYGEVKALKVASLRVPEGASEGAQELAAQALGRVVDVMMERCSGFQSGSVLKAATRIREEICGPLSQKVEVSGTLQTLTDEQLQAKVDALIAKASSVPESDR